jgi:hypothetical protein
MHLLSLVSMKLVFLSARQALIFRNNASMAAVSANNAYIVENIIVQAYTFFWA